MDQPPPAAADAAETATLPDGGWLGAVGESFYRDSLVALFGRSPECGLPSPSSPSWCRSRTTPTIPPQSPSGSARLEGKRIRTYLRRQAPVLRTVLTRCSSRMPPPAPPGAPSASGVDGGDARRHDRSTPTSAKPNSSPCSWAAAARRWSYDITTSASMSIAVATWRASRLPRTAQRQRGGAGSSPCRRTVPIRYQEWYYVGAAAPRPAGDDARAARCRRRRAAGAGWMGQMDPLQLASSRAPTANSDRSGPTSVRSGQSLHCCWRCSSGG